ncbi:hypothetical protein IC805_05230 [Geobacillus thermoleovorans]|uniref:hypothetical protein n=1 Tax=Geobacillus thermoleovorans TaxID=33941 RepID=UPI0009C0496A|nr:hypothetical protein [Geobacillus thermoleovorans]OQP13142.1 hypothetical protein B1692_08795 [Geobacillus thermoleovorans]QNU22344.1 hypothetical protein IC805_05230 [Geobacillus thermoleovorans]
MENKVDVTIHSKIINDTMPDAKISCASITFERFKEQNQKTRFLIAVVERTVEPKHKTEIMFEAGKDIPIPHGYELKTVKYVFCGKCGC